MNNMDIHIATEESYKNGYAKGFQDGKREAGRKKSQWIWHEAGWWQCKECGCSPADWEADPDNEYGLPPFCHSCGAEMNLKGE